MNAKTFLTAVLGAFAGLALAMGGMLYAQNTDHMSGYQAGSMMGQTQQKKAPAIKATTDWHQQMHGKTATLNNHHATGKAAANTHHGSNQATTNTHHGAAAAAAPQGMMGGMMGQSGTPASTPDRMHGGQTVAKQSFPCHSGASS